VFLLSLSSSLSLSLSSLSCSPLPPEGRRRRSLRERERERERERRERERETQTESLLCVSHANDIQELMAKKGKGVQREKEKGISFGQCTLPLFLFTPALNTLIFSKYVAVCT